MERPSRFPLYLGVLLIAAGWAVLLVGWYQAGRQDLETGQIPYLLSGGFGGWGLLVMGGMAVLVDTVRQAEWRAMRRVDDVESSLERIADALERATRPPRPPREAEPAKPTTPRRRPRRRGAGGSRRSQEPDEG